MKRIFDKIRSFFGKSKTPAITPSYSNKAPIPLQSAEEKLTLSYKQYRKAMRKKGKQPATFSNWMKSKHPLHFLHSGTFSPIKTLPTLYRKNKSTVLRIA